ncbi:MAG: helix-turn-helix domain-containing protein [Ruminococcaceae bacterium]|nr:helix-turn-helix domain-containing protein [Oscillospiraceae bacterium]
MKAELVAEYLSHLRLKTGLTYESVAEKSNRSVSTVKKLCNGQTEDPRVDTVAPVVYALGGSMDEMLNPGKNKNEIKEVSVSSLKELYEFQLTTMKETNEEHISNIRSHYEQHHEDLKENFERRLADKREINESYKEQIKDLKRANLIKGWIIAGLAAIFVVLFIMEILHPEHGWLRY